MYEFVNALGHALTAVALMLSRAWEESEGEEPRRQLDGAGRMRNGGTFSPRGRHDRDAAHSVEEYEMRELDARLLAEELTRASRLARADQEALFPRETEEDEWDMLEGESPPPEREAYAGERVFREYVRRLSEAPRHPSLAVVYLAHALLSTRYDRPTVPRCDARLGEEDLAEDLRALPRAAWVDLRHFARQAALGDETPLEIEVPHLRARLVLSVCENARGSSARLLVATLTQVGASLLTQAARAALLGGVLAHAVASRCSLLAEDNRPSRAVLLVHHLVACPDRVSRSVKLEVAPGATFLHLDAAQVDLCPEALVRAVTLSSRPW